jgi:ubiquitin-like protein Nedd8
MLIKLRNIAGKESEYDVEMTDTIKQLKQRIEDKEGVSPEQQKIIFKV